MSEQLRDCYKQLVDFNPGNESRISPLIPIGIHNNQELAVSIVEREYSGSESYAIFIYELTSQQPSLIDKPIQKPLVTGELANVRLASLRFACSENSQEFEELYLLIEKSLSELDSCVIPEYQL